MINRGRLWLICGALVAIVVIVVGWFGLAAPQLEQAAQADESRASVEAQNEAERAVLAEMKRQYESLDELLAQLEELQLSVPGSRDLEDFYDEIAASANLAGVVLNGVTVEPALPYAAAVAEGGAVAPPPVEESEDGAEEADADAPPVTNDVSYGTGGTFSAPVPSAALQSSLYVLPITLKITADVNQASLFLALLQKAEGRLVLIDGLTLTLGSSLTGELKGYIFVVHDPSTGPVGALPEPEPEETATPAPTESATPKPGETATPTPSPTP